ncbi:MAG TPA: response regulator [Magnetospirillum sp.]|nr:response regulator [Magnetospirillum sp.]
MKSPAVAALARRYRSMMTAGTLLYLVLCGLTLWAGWTREYEAEVQLDIQRVQKDAIRLKGIITAASDHLAQMAEWAEDFPDHSPYGGAADLRLAAEQSLATSKSRSGNVNLDELAAQLEKQRLGLLIAVPEAAQPRANGKPSNLDLGLSLLDRFRYGQATIPFLRWSYIFTARKDMLAMAPWASSADVLGTEPDNHSFLQHSWTYEITERGLPANNPDRKPYWTKAYPDQAGAGLMVSYGIPVYWDNEFVGAMGVDILLSFLSDFLAEFPDPDGILLIANEHGELLGDRQGIVRQSKDVQTVDAALPDALKPWSSGLIRRTANGTVIDGWHVISETIASPEWTIIYLVPRSTLAARVAKEFSPLLGLTLLLMSALGLMNRFLRRWYVDPALGIAGYVAHEGESAGTSPPPVPAIWRPWVDAMVQAFRERRQYLADLRTANEELEQRVADRTSALMAANERQAEIDREATARLERRNWALEAHAAAAAALGAAESEEALIARVCQAIVTQKAFTLALVGLAEDGAAKPVRVVCAEGPARKYADEITMSWSEDRADGRGATGTCIRSCEPQVVSLDEIAFGGYHHAAARYGFRSACVLPLKDGKRTFGVLNVYSSTSDLFDAEMVERLVHLAEQLAFGILSRAARRAHEELEQSLFQARKLETLGRLAGGVAHDFNNLLAAILGFSEFITEDLPDDHPSKRHATRIQTAAYRGKALVEQILAFTRQSEIRRNRFVLAETVSETMSLLQPIVPPPLMLRSEIATPEVVVEADKAQLGRVLMNLCVNARDAMEGCDGGIVVGLGETDLHRPAVARLASSGTGDVEVWTDAEGTNWAISGGMVTDHRYVSLIVSDNGPGMEASLLDRAFEPFFTTKGRARGSGLGLAVVQGIILNHGGAIIVRSRPGAGTDVEIVLPALDEEKDAKPPAGPHSAEPAHGRVLIVDDDPEASDAVAEALRRRGWTITQCGNAADALSMLARDSRFDVVLSDQIMPETCGTELIRAIRLRHPNLPCVLYSGYDERLDERIAAECGARALLSKPLDFDELSDILSKHSLKQSRSLQGS